jgi:hypothetical protein
MAKKKRKKNEANIAWPTYNIRFDPDELRTKLRLDRNALDDEVEQQAEIFGEVGEAAAYAKSAVDSLEEELKELEATLDSEAREDAEANDDRITENAIKARVAGDASRKVMVIKLLGARDLQRRLDALTTAFRQRSYMLRDMVDLNLAGYYTSTSMKGARGEQLDAEVDRITTRMSERREKRVKRHRARK